MCTVDMLMVIHMCMHTHTRVSVHTRQSQGQDTRRGTCCIPWEMLRQERCSAKTLLHARACHAAGFPNAAVMGWGMQAIPSP